jgi:threonine/homoserine/homoserine lactone efflux protein
VAAVLVVSTPNARRNGPAFAVGWIVGLTALTALTVAVFAGASDSGSSSRTVVDVLRVVAGVALLVAAARKWRHRPRDGETGPTPPWMTSVETMSARGSLVLGLGLGGINPKNLAFALTAASSIITLGADDGDIVIAVAVFVLLASLSVIGPVAARLLLGDRASPPLDAIKGFMLENNTAILMVVFILIGVNTLGNGIAGLTA